MVCASCGNAKDATERYQMPGATRSAATVTDAALLRMASAGPNWECAYCGSHQRAPAGECAQCGASHSEGRPIPRPQPSAPTAAARASARLRAVVRRVPRPVRVALAVTAALALAGTAWLLMPRTFDGTVANVHWEQRVHVDRYRIWEREGFAEQIPATALDRAPRGERHHHDVDVLDHYETETYTEDVACGEDCEYVAETCSETCSDDGNGFATCTESCSGGGQSCTTRYCPETRTREVPVYRSEPVYAPWFAYHLWDWGEDRVIAARGDDLSPRWPADDEVALGRALGAGEREREHRETEYLVRFRDPEDASGSLVEYHAASAAELARFAPGSVHRVRVWLTGTVEIAGD